jgi:hypothetical protein
MTAVSDHAAILGNRAIGTLRQRFLGKVFGFHALDLNSYSSTFLFNDLYDAKIQIVWLFVSLDKCIMNIRISLRIILFCLMQNNYSWG